MGKEFFSSPKLPDGIWSPASVICKKYWGKHLGSGSVNRPVEHPLLSRPFVCTGYYGYLYLYTLGKRQCGLQNQSGGAEGKKNSLD
jgi:hypothetical protein